MYTVTKDGKTFDELSGQISSKTFKNVWQIVMASIYPDNEVLDDSWPELDGEDLYKRLRPFQLADDKKIFTLKVPFSEVLTEIENLKANQLAQLTSEFDYLQREKDYTDRFNNLPFWRQASNELSLFEGYNNSALLLKKIIDDDLGAELSSIEIKHIDIKNEFDFQEKVSIMQSGQSVGSRVIAVIAQLNTDNGVTPTQLNTIYSNPSIQAILALLQTGALNSAKFQIQNLDLTGLEPMDDSYKTRIISMIDTALGIV